MKSVKILLALSAIALLTTVFSTPQNQCNIYKCSTTNPSTATGQCFSKSKDSNGAFTYQFNQCSSDYNCFGSLVQLNEVSTNLLGNSSNCVQVSSDARSAWQKAKDLVSNLLTSALDSFLQNARGLLDGQKCSKNENCRSNSCVSSKCVGSAAGASCTAHEDCSTGNACINSKCAAQVAANGPCLNEYDCANDLTCSNLKCVKYYSIENGQVTTSSNACTSGFSYPSASNQNTCDTPSIANSNCSATSDVCEIKMSSLGITYNKKCDCTPYSETQATTCTNYSISKPTTYSNVQTKLRYSSDINAIPTSSDDAAKNIYPDCIRKTIWGPLSSGLVKASAILIAFLFAFFF